MLALSVVLAFAPPMSTWGARFALLAGGLSLLAFWYELAFRRIEPLELRLKRQNRELLALHEASLAITAELSIDSVLQTVVDRARELIGTRFAALSVIDEQGRITNFLTAGIDAATRSRIGDPPNGHGLLGVALRDGQRLRSDDIASDPRSVGFPANHPPMRSLLAVPVAGRGPHRGNLYLSEKAEGGGFSAADEEALARLASQAAIAIDNAHLHRQVLELGAARERLRIAHEMHDGLAQVLAYVNTQAQAVREHLRQERREEAEKRMSELAEAARRVYADVRQQILELRTVAPAEAGLLSAIADYVMSWERQSGIEADLELPAALELPPEIELQLLRILQEALTNVRKHAAATRVRVAIERVADRLRLLVEDDGGGFDLAAERPGPGPRFGLKTMGERAAAMGATMAVESKPGKGTRVEVLLPAPGVGFAKARNATPPR